MKLETRHGGDVKGNDVLWSMALISDVSSGHATDAHCQIIFGGGTPYRFHKWLGGLQENVCL